MSSMNLSGGRQSCGCSLRLPRAPRSKKLPELVRGARWIPLTKGKFTLVDAADFAWLTKFNWSLDSNGYASRSDYPDGWRSKRTVRMHQVILRVKDGFEVDHVNRNPLDNRRRNLRPATRRQTVANKAWRNKTGFKGVSARKEGGFRARVRAGGLELYEDHTTLKAAALAYRRLSRRAFGEFASSAWIPATPNSGASSKARKR